MYTKDVLWTTGGDGKVLRILSYDNDASMLYSWKPYKKNEASTVVYIRHFNPNTEEDKVVLISKSFGEFVNASISKDHCAIAFTVWIDHETAETRSKQFQVITTHNPKVSEYYTQEIIDACPIKSHLLGSSRSVLSDKDVIPKSLIGDTTIHATYHRGIYKSYLAQVFPSDWCWKFDTDRKLIQQVIFTNFPKLRASGDIQLTQYEVVLIMHRESIGVYTVVLEHDFPTVAGGTSSFGQSTSSSSTSELRCRVFDKPSSEVLTDREIWCQWDSANQRLYYIAPARKSASNPKSSYCQLVCYQFYAGLPRQRVLNVSLDLGLSRYALLNRSSLTFHRELEPTIASRELNIRICVFNDTGTMCLCWQELPSHNVVPQWAYSIAILTKDIIIRHKFVATSSTTPVSFSTVGPNLLVQCPGSYLHLYDVESICCEQERMSNGLYHMRLADKHFSSVVDSSMEFLFPLTSLDESVRPMNKFEDSILSDSMDSLSSSSSLSSSGGLCGSTVCFDRSAKAFVSLQFDVEEFGKLLSSPNLSIQNKIFLTRQAILSTKGHASATGALVKVVEIIMQEPTDPSVAGIIAQLLIATSCMDLCDPKHGIPPAMRSLFPITLPTSALEKLTSKTEEGDGAVSYHYIDVRHKIKSQIKEYVGTVSLMHKMSPTVRRAQSQDHDSLHGNPHSSSSVHEIKDALWFRTLSACDSGTFTEYDLGCIGEELTILERSFKHPGSLNTAQVPHQSAMLLDRLTTLFRKDFLRIASSTEDLESNGGLVTVESLSFLNDNERDKKSENIMVLTSEKLCDHLSAHERLGPDPVTSLNLAQISRDYVQAQVRQARHNLALIMLKSELEDFERPLFSSASSKEQDLLLALNQFQLACNITCFPLPNGFHTFVTCLLFRCLLARFSFPCADHRREVDVLVLSERFFDYVDRNMIQLTDEFVARMLEELGDIEPFSIIVEEVLKRTRGLDNDDVATFGGLEQWRHPTAKTHLARAHLKGLYKTSDVLQSPVDAETSEGTKRSRSHSGTSTKEQTVPSLLKEMKNTSSGRVRSGSAGSQRRRSFIREFRTGFPPLDIFLDFVSRAEVYSVDGGRAHRTNETLHVTNLVRAAVLKT